MIYVNNENVFHLSTANTSLVIVISKTKHVQTLYYGQKLKKQDDYLALLDKWPAPHGSCVIFDQAIDENECLDLLSLELSTFGKGDFREPSLILKNKYGYVFDFQFDKYEIKNEVEKLIDLPSPHDGDEELVIYLKDEHSHISLELHYIIFTNCDIIVRNLVIKNASKEELHILKAMSLQMDICNDNFELINLYGAWINEANKSTKTLSPGIYLNDSKTGASSNRHNPFFIIKNKYATYDQGKVYEFNLMYSGNHASYVEVSTFDKVRIQSGISSFNFDYILEPNDVFTTPYAIMTFSKNGINKASQNMHRFVNENVISLNWKYKERPIIINNWEATYFRFTKQKLLSIAKKAKNLGMELFVLDDGWFGSRSDDKQGLGDWEVNLKKLPGGITNLAKEINKIGLKFGLWFEPEMVNENSNLYREHPEWAIKHPLYKPSLGRNQLVLDLSKVEVQDYIINAVSIILKNANVEYVKWDMNRHISDMYSNTYEIGEMYHRYILGLYRILSVLTNEFPNVLFESCSSGGNRFDLGMLSYMPQTWASDDTDGYQRINIQSGYALGYPLSSISAHVSASPSHQLLRKTPLNTRFNVASFGVLGYELDITALTSEEEKEITNQIALYKEFRSVFQFGTFYQIEDIKENRYASFEVIDKDKKTAIIGYFNGLAIPNPPIACLKGYDFDESKKYNIDVVSVSHNIKTFGGLINIISPIHLNENGFLVNQISKFKRMPGEIDSYVATGDVINEGALKLSFEWAGSGFNDHVRVLLDFGSRLYVIKENE